MIKNNSTASLVSHAENVLYEIKTAIEGSGSSEQKELLVNALDTLEQLYFTLREEE